MRFNLKGIRASSAKIRGVLADGRTALFEVETENETLRIEEESPLILGELIDMRSFACNIPLPSRTWGSPTLNNGSY